MTTAEISTNAELEVTVTTVVERRTNLLDPTAVLTDVLTDGLDAGPLHGAGLVPLGDLLDGDADYLVTELNQALTPLVGLDYAANHPNNLDPIDNLLVGTAATVKSAVGGDVDALFGAGTLDAALTPAGLQADYLTDLLSTDLDTLGLSALADNLATVESTLAPINATLTDLENQVFALGGEFGAPVVGLLATVGGDDLALGSTLGGVLAPVTGLVGGLIDNLPVVTLPDLGGDLAPIVELVSGFATDGLLNVGSADLPGASGLLALINSNDPTGIFAPVPGLVEGGAALLPLPGFDLDLDASALLGTVDTLQAVAGPFLEIGSALPSISSLGGTASALPDLGSLLPV